MDTNSMSYKSKQFLMFAGVTTAVFAAVVIVPVSSSATLADGAYWQALGRTIIYSVIAVILVNVVAFILAFLVTSGVKGQNFFRAGFFVPNLIGGIVLGYIWKFVFNRA